MSARVELIGKPGCHLCDLAREVVAEVCSSRHEQWAELSILDDPELADRYSDRIPVVLVDGALHDFWHVDPGGLAAALDLPRAAL